jgi:homoserine O-acetyltransferase
VVDHFRTNFIPGADANNLILHMRTWEYHDVGKNAALQGRRDRAALD